MIKYNIKFVDETVLVDLKMTVARINHLKEEINVLKKEQINLLEQEESLLNEINELQIQIRNRVENQLRVNFNFLRVNV